MFKKIIKKLELDFCNTNVANVDKPKNLKKETKREGKINEIPM